MPRQSNSEWAEIEKAYKLGQLSVREIARLHGIQASSIIRKAQKENWVRDFRQELQVRTHNALISNSKDNTPTREDIDTAVEINKAVVNSNRRDVQKHRSIVDLLASQLDEVAKGREEVAGTIEIETLGDNDTKRRNQMLKAISLPTHAGVARDLSVALKNLIPLERQAFGIDNGSTEEGGGVTVIIHRDGNPNSSADQAD